MNAHTLHEWTRRLAPFATITFFASTAHAAEGGLQLVPDWATAAALLVAFLVLVIPLNALLLKPLVKALDEREERITGTRAKAERLATEGQEVLERYEAAIRQAREASELARRGKLEEARASMIDTTATARSAAESELERARNELANTLAGARQTLRTQANDLARDAAAQVLGRPL